MAIKRNRSARLDRTNIITAAVMAACISLSAHAQEQIEPAESQLKMPAQEVERLQRESEALKQDKNDADDPAKAISPNDPEKSKAVTPSSNREQPSGLKDSEKLPAVQQDKLPAVQQDKLPAVQKDKLPAVQKQQPVSGEPEFVRVAPASGAPGSQIRIEGRHFGPDRGDRGLYFIIEGRGYGMAIRGWHDNQIMAVVPRHVDPGSAEIRMVSRDPDTILTAIDFEVISAIADRDVLPDNAGRPDTGGFVAEPPSIDKAELAIISGPTWRWDDGTRGAGSVLYYGHRYEVSFVVENLGDQPARYRPKYEIGNELRGFPERTIDPGETQRITWDVPFGISPHGTEVRQRIMKDEEIDSRVFLAEAELGAGVYADSNVSNNVSRRSWDVRRRLRLHVQLQRLNQYERCDRWVRDRDWQLWTYLTGTEEGRAHLASLDGNPAFLDASVKATMSLGPLGYRSLVEPGASEIGFEVWLHALKDDGSIKNIGRKATFSMTHSLSSLMDGRVSREVRSTEPGGSFCGEGNLGIDALMWLSLAPYK